MTQSYESNIISYVAIWFIIYIICYFINPNNKMIIVIVWSVIIFHIVFPYISNKCFKCQYSKNEMFDENSTYPNRITRDKRLYDLNRDRGFTGRFYVKCHDCDRNRAIEEKKRHESPSPHKNLYCMTKCCDRTKTNDTMSFYNNKYIDTDKIFCYNCLGDDKTHKLVRNFRTFPAINGPPDSDNMIF